MLNFAGNTLRFFLNRIGKKDVTEIFQKAQNASTETEYGYTEQKGITGKPSIVFTGEGLKRYSLPIKLHYSYCNPNQILTGLKEKAKNSEVISYFQEDEYKGEFVITKIAENPITRYKDKVLYAEITIDLLEVPVDPDEEYTQKTNPNKSLFDNLLEEKVTTVKDAVKKVTNNAIVQTITDSAIDFALGQAGSYVTSATGGLLR